MVRKKQFLDFLCSVHQLTCMVLKCIGKRSAKIVLGSENHNFKLRISNYKIFFLAGDAVQSKNRV